MVISKISNYLGRKMGPREPFAWDARREHPLYITPRASRIGSAACVATLLTGAMIYQQFREPRTYDPAEIYRPTATATAMLKGIKMMEAGTEAVARSIPQVPESLHPERLAVTAYTATAAAGQQLKARAASTWSSMMAPRITYASTRTTTGSTWLAYGSSLPQDVQSTMMRCSYTTPVKPAPATPLRSWPTFNLQRTVKAHKPIWSLAKDDLQSRLGKPTSRQVANYVDLICKANKKYTIAQWARQGGAADSKDPRNPHYLSANQEIVMPFYNG